MHPNRPFLAIPRAIAASAHREKVIQVVRAALAAVSPEAVIRKRLKRRGDRLTVDRVPYDLGRIRKICVLGAGKAAQPMAEALFHVLKDRLSDGLVIVKRGTMSRSMATGPVAVRQAAHPLPDAAGVRATRRMVQMARALGPEDLGIVLVSGGASSLMTLPAEGIALEDLVRTTDRLLRSGATIQELNTVRRHLSAVQGGRLAAMIAPGRTLALVLSDVVGDPWEAIGSGPTAPDPSTFGQALDVLARHRLVAEVPQSVHERLVRGSEGAIENNPKADDPLFDKVHNCLVGSNRLAAEAAVAAARACGLNARVLTTTLEGEARKVGREAAELARAVLRDGGPVPRPACLILGGETTVVVRGTGKGGRNQEVALSAAIGLEGQEGALLVALATDGEDGPTDAAGAIAGSDTMDVARSRGLCAKAYLEDNNAYGFFHATGDLIAIGPTRTNVADLIFLFVF